MSLKQKLFWEKYRPKSQRGMIILPRIESIIKHGIQTNMIFYGSSGIGKTTLANILSEEHNMLKLSGKLGIDVLTTTIQKHLQGLSFGTKSDLKVIYIDEFDRASKQLQEALKGFMESYEYARFIFTTNHLSDIDKELRSRFLEIGFDPQDSEERKFLHTKQVNYLRAITKREGSELYKDEAPFVKLVNKYFPDLRKSIEVLNIILLTGDISMFEKDFGGDKESLYNFVLEGNLNPIVNYDYVMNNYFVNFEDAFQYLGRPFFEYLREYHVEKIVNKGAMVLKIQGEYTVGLQTTTDPIIHLINYILSLKETLKD
jgi:GTP-binding protein EngB required for normal cell division